MFYGWKQIAHIHAAMISLDKCGYCIFLTEYTIPCHHSNNTLYYYVIYLLRYSSHIVDTVYILSTYPCINIIRDTWCNAIGLTGSINYFVLLLWLNGENPFGVCAKKP